MIELKNVTLVTIDTTDNLDGTLKAIYTSMSGINFASVKLITTEAQIERNRYLEWQRGWWDSRHQREPSPRTNHGSTRWLGD